MTDSGLSLSLHLPSTSSLLACTVRTKVSTLLAPERHPPKVTCKEMGLQGQDYSSIQIHFPGEGGSGGSARQLLKHQLQSAEQRAGSPRLGRRPSAGADARRGLLVPSHARSHLTLQRRHFECLSCPSNRPVRQSDRRQKRRRRACTCSLASSSRIQAHSCSTSASLASSCWPAGMLPGAPAAVPSPPARSAVSCLTS